jgi:hypothetical protein
MKRAAPLTNAATTGIAVKIGMASRIASRVELPRFGEQI